MFDKISMSAFEGTPLDMALPDGGILAFAIVGIAMDIGIEPTVRHGADLGCIPWLSKTPVDSVIAMPPSVHLPALNSRAMF